MTVLQILQYPDKRLSVPGEKVLKVDGGIKKIIADMFETHYAQKNCAALAATQLGIPLCITVIDFSEEKNKPLCLINPEIIKREGETNTPEGCMSVSGVHSKVKRAEKITVEAWNEEGKTIVFDADGFMAKCIQHEVDHLNGMVFIRRLSSVKQKLIDRKFFS